MNAAPKFPIFKNINATFQTWGKALASMGVTTFGLSKDWVTWTPITAVAGGSFLVDPNSKFQYLPIPAWSMCLLRINGQAGSSAAARNEAYFTLPPGLVPSLGSMAFGDAFSVKLTVAGTAVGITAVSYLFSDKQNIALTRTDGGALAVAPAINVFSINGFFRVESFPVGTL